jgi:hypothetical protein
MWHDVYIMMWRTQVLLPHVLRERVAEYGRTTGQSQGEIVRQALTQLLDRPQARAASTSGAKSTRAARDEVVSLLVDEPFDDPQPDAHLARDADHHLYGALRRSRKRAR